MTPKRTLALLLSAAALGGAVAGCNDDGTRNGGDLVPTTGSNGQTTPNTVPEGSGTPGTTPTSATEQPDGSTTVPTGPGDADGSDGGTGHP